MLSNHDIPRLHHPKIHFQRTHFMITSDFSATTGFGYNLRRAALFDGIWVATFYILHMNGVNVFSESAFLAGVMGRFFTAFLSSGICRPFFLGKHPVILRNA